VPYSGQQVQPALLAGSDGSSQGQGPNADFVSAYNKSKELEKDVIPRAAAVTAHAQNLLPGVIYPISIKILSLLFVIQLLSTFLSSRTGTSQFFVDTARFMFFLIMILTFASG